MATVGTVRVVPALGPALMVHIHLRGGGVSFQMIVDPGRDRWREENGVDESP